MKKQDIEIILDVLFENNKDFIVDFLSDHNLPTTGTKEELKSLVKDQVSQKKISPDEIVALVNKIEGWGNQRIYLFKVHGSLNKSWKDEGYVKTALKRAGALGLLNVERPLVLPQEQTLSVVEWSEERVKFVWICKVSYDERLKDEDEWDDERNLEYRAYRPRVKRGIVTFDWDLESGIAMLMIQRMPTETIHKEILDTTWKHLTKFVDSKLVKIIKLGNVIEKLEQTTDVRVRKGTTETTDGMRVDFKSKSRKHDAKSSPKYKKSKQALGRTFGYFGNFYWKVNDNISKEIHTNLYSQNNSILIFSQHPEEEVRYVIDCIVEHSKN